MKTFIQTFFFAVQFLTRIPVPFAAAPDEQLARRSLALFPLVGWLIGGLLYFLCIIILLPGKFSPLTVAVLLVAAETMLTGAFHLDGLADTFDAFFSTARTPEEKLAIMKDSRIGVMGAVALILSLLVKICCINECIRYDLKAVITIYPVMGRLAQVALYRTCSYVRSSGIGAFFSKAATARVFSWALIAALPSVLLLTPLLIAAYGLFAAFLFFYKRYAEHHIGGITGDVLGAATVLSEIVFIGSFLIGLWIKWFMLQMLTTFTL